MDVTEARSIDPALPDGADLTRAQRPVRFLGRARCARGDLSPVLSGDEPRGRPIIHQAHGSGHELAVVLSVRGGLGNEVVHRRTVAEQVVRCARVAPVDRNGRATDRVWEGVLVVRHAVTIGVDRPPQGSTS